MNNNPSRTGVPRATYWTIRQQEYVKERRNRLNQLYANETFLELKAIHQAWAREKELGVSGTHPDQILSQPWHTVKDFGGKTGYVLEDIGKYVKGNLFATNWEMYKEAVADNGQLVKWILDPKKMSVGNYGDDAPEPHFPENMAKMYSAAMEAVTLSKKEQTEAAEHLDIKSWNKVAASFKFLRHLRVLRRFLDRRNPEISSFPLPDGSNLAEAPFVQIGWFLYRAYIRALHLRSLQVGDEPLGQQHIYEVLRLALGFLVLENQRVPRYPAAEQQNRLDLASELLAMYRQVYAGLENLSKLLFTNHRSGSIVYTLEETFKYNTHPSRFPKLLAENIKILSDRLILPTIQVALWTQLMFLTQSFEQANDVFHVEDIQITKRIVMKDERFKIMELLKDSQYDETFIIDVPEYQEDRYSHIIETQMRIHKCISLINRLRRSHLLLKDWSKRRPWKQLYVVWRASRDGSSLGPAIQHFNETIKRHLNYYTPTHSDTPSNPGNLYSSIFPIHPLDARNLPPDDELKYLRNTLCSFCQDALEESSQTQILAQLPCLHVFHYTCIREFWDRPFRRLFPCPLCKCSVLDWRLHEIAGIEPEALETWDQEEVLGPSCDPDAGQAYESMLMMKARERVAMGVFGQATFVPTVESEMHLMRLQRRNLDDRIKKRLKKNRRGIYASSSRAEDEERVRQEAQQAAARFQQQNAQQQRQLAERQQRQIQRQRELDEEEARQRRQQQEE